MDFPWPIALSIALLSLNVGARLIAQVAGDMLEETPEGSGWLSAGGFAVLGIVLVSIGIVLAASMMARVVQLRAATPFS